MYRLNVLHKVHKGGVGAIRLKQLSLIEEGVDEVRVVVEVVCEAGVGDLQHHLENLLHNRLVRCLGEGQIM